ncbi:MAG: thymidine phosphorylase, partial [Acidimicrobiales bacterium]
LRDVTGTVESVPLIASSIMSKKIAEGAESLVLDVKVGLGAFMREIDEARELAQAMVELGDSHGVRTTALLTNMDSVIGLTAGNGIEVQEALDVLEGHGPADVVEISLALADEMIELADLEMDPADALESGDALITFKDMISAQGGRLDAGLPVAPHNRLVNADSSGFIDVLDAYAVGVAAWRLGAGRSRKEDMVSATAGVICLAKPGDEVATGQPLFELRADDPTRFAAAEAALVGAVTTAPEPAETPPLILDRIT